MNILLFVMTILMMLSLLTYGRLESFRNFSATKAELERYMEKNEREFFNLRNVKWYNDTHVTEKGKQNRDKDDASKASSRLSIYPLVNKESKEAEWETFAPTRTLTISLIKVLYSNKPFFKKIAQEQAIDPFLDEMLHRMHNAAIKLSADNKIKAPSDLANLDLGDPLYKDIFYKILNGTRRTDSRKVAISKAKNTADEDIEDFEVDDGYLSLLDFVTVKNKSKVRVFLASKPLLEAMMQNPGQVSYVLNLRNNYYSNVKKGVMDAKQASKEFERLFKGSVSTIVDDNILDFTVTKTDPRAYE